MDRNRGLTPRSFFPDLFSSNFTFPSLWDMGEKMGNWFGGETGVTVSEDSKNVYVEAHLPGLKTDDLDISLDRNTLRIKGERSEEENQDDRKFYRRAQRSFFYQVELPSQVEENAEQAQYQDGVLQIIFKKTKSDNVKKIAVRTGSQQQQQKLSTTQQSGSQQTNSQQQQTQSKSQQKASQRKK